LIDRREQVWHSDITNICFEAFTRRDPNGEGVLLHWKEDIETVRVFQDMRARGRSAPGGQRRCTD
jgi:hypothetical protein